MKKLILSHKNKFIFIKGRKIAGTAIEMALSRRCGDMDVITPISVGDEAQRASWGRGAQNYCRMYHKGGEVQLDQIYYNHMPISELPEMFGYRVWTVDRHPYDKVLSQSGYLNCSVDEVLSDLGKCPLNWPLYCMPDGQIVADVYKYENLDQVERDFEIKLPRAKALHCPEQWLSDEEKQKIQKIFEYEFELHEWEK